MSDYHLALFHRAVDLLRRDSQAGQPSRELANLLSEFWAVAQEEKPAWAKPLLKVRLFADPETQKLHPEAFQALQKAGEKFWPSQFPKPEVPSVQELHRQGVSEWQICQTWGLMRNGCPDVERLQRELEKPGSETKNDTPLPVRQVETALKGQLAQWKELCQALAAQVEPNQTEAPKPEELLRQGANIDQVAQVTGLSADEVRALARKLKLPARSAGEQLADPEAPASRAIPAAAQSEQAWADSQREAKVAAGESGESPEQQQ